MTGIGLLIWSFWITDDLSIFTKNLPDVPLFFILINGIGFAFFNALAEEYLSRGMLCNGLEKIFSSKTWIILIQALLFSIWHYHGYPGGIIGMTMVLFWSIILGLIRYRTGGLMGVIIGHFFADFTIYIILYSIK